MGLIKNVSNNYKSPIIKFDEKNNLDKEYKVVFIGDISFAENYVLEYVSRPNIGVNIIEHYGHDYFFERVKNVLFDADLVIANLETPLLDIQNTPRPSFTFSTRFNNKTGRFQHWSDPKKTPTYLKKYNIANVSLANNHMLDFGIEGLYQTLESLNNYNIRFFGAGYNRKQARTPLSTEIVVGKQILKLVVFSAFEHREGYDKDFSFYAGKSKPGVNRLSFQTISKKIKKIREEIENVFIVIFPHWGGTRTYGPKTDRQTEMGHKLIDGGADLVIGQGPHNQQIIEKYKGRWIIYSIGNFIYNSFGRFGRYNAPPYGLVVKLVFSENQNKNHNKPMLDISNVPIKKSMRIYAINTDNAIINFQPRLVNEKEFEYLYKFFVSDKDLLKPSKQETTVGIDKMGRFFELSLD